MSSSHEIPDICQRLRGPRVVFIGSPLDGAAANLIIAQLLHLESRDPTAAITVRIHCVEADLPAALAVYDVMQALRAPVETLCSGTAAGGAALLLAAGTPGRGAGARRRGLSGGMLPGFPIRAARPRPLDQGHSIKALRSRPLWPARVHPAQPGYAGAWEQLPIMSLM